MFNMDLMSDHELHELFKTPQRLWDAIIATN
jgi:hypothetical protein